MILNTNSMKICKSNLILSYLDDSISNVSSDVVSIFYTGNFRKNNYAVKIREWLEINNIKYTIGFDVSGHPRNNDFIGRTFYDIEYYIRISREDYILYKLTWG